MSRSARGSFEARVLADESRSFHLRLQREGRRHTLVLHERRECACGCGGGWEEAEAREELREQVAWARSGLRPAPRPSRPARGRASGSASVPTFAEYAAWWLEAKIAGVLGERPISENTARDYRSRLGHLACLGACRVDQIDAALCLELKAHLLAQSRAVREALEAGVDLREASGRRRRPLGPSMIRKVLAALRSILEDAVEDGLLERNPAQGRRMRVAVPKPKRGYLEIDELAYLLDAAAEQDDPLAGVATPPGGASAVAVVRLTAQGLRPRQVAERLELSRSTVTHHLRRLGVETGRGYAGRRVVCELLGRAGLRVGELCEARVGDLRLDAEGTARLRIGESKTEAGRRLVELSPELTAAVLSHLDRLRAQGRPTGPDAYLVPGLRDGRLSRRRVGQILAEAARLAGERLAAKGMAPLPHITPHTLRRTYISIALVANQFDVKFVMAQVGHAGSSMTMDVYAQLEQRAKRSHGEGFDRLLAEARERTEALPLRAASTPAEERYDVFI
ncbi:MAG: tyrosine-type recombinase/integrase [Thermoleophilia bacterium]